ncbi:uncharacterized protein [Neodiprion pinetum]|uniref:uncharacterized protein n=1 Tax=Neodiprion pinetum TaxID=441929 RepID=UPI001EE089D4|nr:uncharacterized protein LOC124222709 [Neodiprion pinetum]
MPKLKQPTPLTELVFDFIVNHCANYCHQLSLKGNLEKLRRTINEIKTELFRWMPLVLRQRAAFCSSFITTFLGLGYDVTSSDGLVRPAAHNKAAIEIMMDVEIPGLRCTDQHLGHLKVRDYHRFQTINTLDMRNPRFGYRLHDVLSRFRLENLTQLVLVGWCNNQALEVIGSRCRNLRLLNISNSQRVGDVGLLALLPCTDLRNIDFRACATRITYDTVNTLLSTFTKLEQFNTINHEYYPGQDQTKAFDPCKRERTLVCPSMDRYCFRGTVYNSDLDAVVTLFPNLSRLQFCCNMVGDYQILQNLHNLEELSFWGDVSIVPHLWQLLRIIGENISVLNLHMPNGIPGLFTQNEVNFVHECCKNIREFSFGFVSRIDMDKLLIRPFMKLKKLVIIHRHMRTATIEFQEMPELEDLSLTYFDPIVDIISSMMFDNTRFGNLKKIKCPILDATDHQLLHHLNLIAKERNLDISVVFVGSKSL